MLYSSLVEVLVSILFVILQGYLPKSYPLPQIEDVLPQAISREEATVNKVTDGDTLTVLLNNQIEKVRLIGIDTPETVDPRREVECFGKEASEKMKHVLLNKSVILEQDTTQNNRDKYNRLLRYVFLPDGTFVNKKMIEDGYAFEYTYDSPYRYQKEFREAEIQAKYEKRGLWNEVTCPSE